MHLNAAVDLASKRLSEQISSDSLRVAKTTPSHRVGGSLLFPEERFFRPGNVESIYDDR